MYPGSKMPRDSAYVVILALLRAFINDATEWKKKWDRVEHAEGDRLTEGGKTKFRVFMQKYSKLVDTVITNDILSKSGSKVVEEILEQFHIIHRGGGINLSIDVSKLCSGFAYRKALLYKLHKFHTRVSQACNTLHGYIKQPDEGVMLITQSLEAVSMHDTSLRAGSVQDLPLSLERMQL